MKSSTWFTLAAAATLATQVTLLYMPDPTGVSTASGANPQAGGGQEGEQSQAFPGVGEANQTAPQAGETNQTAPQAEETNHTTPPTSSLVNASQVTGEAVQQVKAVLRKVVRKAPAQSDKAVHASIFAASTVTGIAASRGRWWLLVPAAQGVHALAGEHLQKRIPGRGYDRADIYANLVGVTVGTALGWGLRSLRH
ncbi:MAG: hypothetical protein Q4P06_06185 [Actinomycetaceae bacterium]|nr:hypothetical protein [Actinomycetaceae bacterium]